MDRARPFTHLVLVLGATLMAAPLILAIIAAVRDAPDGGAAISQWLSVLVTDWSTGPPAGVLMAMNTAVFALALAAAKTAFALLAAYALVFFRPPLATVLFWAIMLTLLMPLPTRLAASVDVAHRLGLGTTHASLVLPLAGSALAVVFFRQVMGALPGPLIDAARLDGPGPIRFLFTIALPLTRPMFAAVFLVMLIDAWNQYLWPLAFVDRAEFPTLAHGITDALEHGKGRTGALAFALIASLPPVIVLALSLRWIIAALARAGRSAGGHHG